MTHLGVRCPYCKSEDIGAAGDGQAYHLAHAEHLIEEVVQCEECGKMWIDTYTLTCIEEYDPDEKRH
jgi:C4-type Zn-finger protein